MNTNFSWIFASFYEGRVPTKFSFRFETDKNMIKIWFLDAELSLGFLLSTPNTSDIKRPA